MATETPSSPARPKTAPGAARRRFLFHFAALAVSALLFGLGLELVLRLGAGVIAPALGELGNAVYSRYGSLPGDIYVFDHEIGMTFMRPDFETTNYWNGYFWHHATDSRGFRNPPGLEDTSLLVLGDSFIYGHGVEEEQTLTAYLRSEHGRPAYNMGRQGDCLFQHYVLLRLFLDRLQPRRIVLFVFVNDFHDLTVYRTSEQIRERPEIDRYDYDRIYARMQRRGADNSHTVKAHLSRLRAVRLLHALGRRVGLLDLLLPAAVAEAATQPSVENELEDTYPYLATVLDWERFAPLLEYYRDVLADLARRCRERDVELSVVFLDSRGQLGAPGARAQRRIHNQLHKMCRELDLPYHSLRPALRGCDDCYLPGDGHFTPEGHRRVAAFLDRVVLSR